MKMRVPRWMKIPAESINPVAGRAHATFFLLLLLAPFFGMRHIALLLFLRPGLVEHGWIIATVKINIRLHREIIRHPFASVAQERSQDAAGRAAGVERFRVTRLQPCCQAKTAYEQQNES